MFKKFSSLLIIFAVAISLIVLSQTESNAQCDGCSGYEGCVWDVESGTWIYHSYEAVINLKGPFPAPDNIFFESEVYVLQGCLVCQNPETLEERLDDSGTIPGTTALTFSSFFDLQPIGHSGQYTLTQGVCSEGVAEVAEVCAECDGQVEELTLRYDGRYDNDTSEAQIEVYQHNNETLLFESDNLTTGDEFTVFGINNHDTLGPKVYVNGDNNTIIHTSCSDPIGPGAVYGDFTVLSGRSRNGGPLCAVDDDYEVDLTGDVGLTGSECLQDVFEEKWDLSPSADCLTEGFWPSEILITDLLLTGRILDCDLDENGNPYLDENGQLDDCQTESEICLRCQTEEFCRTWNADGEVTYECTRRDIGDCLSSSVDPTWLGSEVLGTVLMGEDDYTTYAWSEFSPNISPDNIEFINVKTNATISADFTSDNTLVLKYENTSGSLNITTPPLIFTFEFDNEYISAVNLVESTFSEDIVMSITSDSITLEVQQQNKNPGDTFTATYNLTFW